MRLYLVQHGEAVSKEIDPDRPLSDRGRRDVERIAALLAGAGLQVGQILHSGKTRASQTAAILADGLSIERPPGARDGLNPKDPVKPVAAEIADFTADTVLVGHLPFMARLATRLLIGNEEPSALAFQPGSVVCLESEDADRWQLLWMIRPELLA